MYSIGFPVVSMLGKTAKTAIAGESDRSQYTAREKLSFQQD